MVNEPKLPAPASLLSLHADDIPAPRPGRDDRPTAASDGPGRGSVFEVTLPTAGDESPGFTPPSAVG